MSSPDFEEEEDAEEEDLEENQNILNYSIRPSWKSSANPEMEKDIVRNFASYGRQIGRISDALNVIINKLHLDLTEENERIPIIEFMQLREQIEEAKEIHLALAENYDQPKLSQSYYSVDILGDNDLPAFKIYSFTLGLEPEETEEIVKKFCAKWPDTLNLSGMNSADLIGSLIGVKHSALSARPSNLQLYARAIAESEIPVRNSPMKGASLDSIIQGGGAVMAAGLMHSESPMFAITHVGISIVVFGVARSLSSVLGDIIYPTLMKLSGLSPDEVARYNLAKQGKLPSKNNKELPRELDDLN